MKKLLVLAVVLGIVFTGFAQVRFFKQGKVAVNPYTPVEVKETLVKGFFVYSDVIGYKIAINGDEYTPMEKGGAFNFSNIDVKNLNVKLQGLTSTDTGLVYYIIQK